jgi:hypothetical protein
VEIDTPESGSLIKKLNSVVHKGLCDRTLILLLPGEIEAGDDTGVLVEARALWETAQGGFDAAHSDI